MFKATLASSQQYINSLNQLLGVSTIYGALIEKAQSVVDNYWKSRKNTFIASFFQQSGVNSEQDVSYFVCMFNILILRLHVMAKRDMGVFLPISPASFPDKVKNCRNCGADSSTSSDAESCHYNICDGCGMISKRTFAASWNDIARVYIAPSYTYNRKGQFKECMLQYQGKCTGVNYSLVENLMAPREPRLTKIQFLKFLRSNLKEDFKSEHVHSLYYRFYSIQPPNFSNTENLILEKFDKVMRSHSEIAKLSGVPSSNNIPNNFLLYQFLKQLGVRVDPDDLMVSETCKTLAAEAAAPAFSQLGWELF